MTTSARDQAAAYSSDEAPPVGVRSDGGRGTRSVQGWTGAGVSRGRFPGAQAATAGGVVT
jgi:hypothetical protein